MNDRGPILVLSVIANIAVASNNACRGERMTVLPAVCLPITWASGGWRIITPQGSGSVHSERP
jgi:hypothetical protein